jgi:hypothetical protein
MKAKTKEFLLIIGGSLLALVLAVGLPMFFAYGLTDAGRAKVQALGDSARVTCYSGGVMFFDACSSGKVHSESSSDGYFFSEKETRWPVEVAGDCTIVYWADCPAEPTWKSSVSQ